ncbi:MAG: hypothetical protein GWM98_13550 [Nitrospinaceae bacterium]|nr:hypothetical protein [Nitrospinaceae bacterium]NIR55309.1 hypothetical protein [Nitrospinaceae bacterium]NIS85748.1 hypothetical protein [Nitrospinaceae bacterium]NIT82598.1 hypothetical protein [Nitrospinaceae bacterium]NIU44803.1 hypothetical protein [Nitrospinaceae bacterium]
MPKPKEFFTLSPKASLHKALQSRIFDTNNEKELLSASAAVLQDLGFQVEEASVEVGVLKAAKERSAREFFQEFGQFLILCLGILGQKVIIIPVDVHQQISATLTTRPVEGDPSRYTVRVLFHRTIWKGHGHDGDREIPPGAQRMEMIHDAQIYQQFFAKLSKSMFLEAHQI